MRRIRFRSPGVKPGQKIGPLGPFRGTLGIQWVIAPLLLALALGAVAWLFLRSTRPDAPWEPVARLDSLSAESAREVAGGIFVGLTSDRRPLAVAEDAACPLDVVAGGYVDCEGVRYELDGGAATGQGGLDLVPLQVHRGEVFIDPTRRIPR